MSVVVVSEPVPRANYGTPLRSPETGTSYLLTAAPSIRYELAPSSVSFLRTDKVPSSQIGSMEASQGTGRANATWMIWFDGGAGVWMQLP